MREALLDHIDAFADEYGWTKEAILLLSSKDRGELVERINKRRKRQATAAKGR